MANRKKTKTALRKKYLGSGAPKGSSVGMINLGCVRNTVDSQMILDRIRAKGHPVVDVRDADIVVVNTCSFIEEARKESVDVILELIDLKNQGRLKRIIVAGCLPQRYGQKLVKEFKGVDALIGVLALDQQAFPRGTNLTPKHLAYVKICEGCYNECSFCAIPGIKGPFVSRPVESILREIKFLDRKGVREINIVGQDITAYGVDLYKEFSLVRLLKEIVAVTKNIEWIRLLYAFPAHVSDELIELVATEKKICKYLDIPLQHISDRLLRRMKRGMFQKGTLRLIERIRERIPGARIRTAFIVGFPGETQDDFDELLRFAQRMKFERVGAFLYSKEEGTSAALFPGHVPEKTKKKRLGLLMEEQQKISKTLQEQFIGKKLKVLIDEKEKGEDNIYLGRSEFDAPEVDGLVYVRADQKLKQGDFVEVLITDAYEYDLQGDVMRD